MTLPKKGFRKIVVADITYQYKITGEDYGIGFLIGLYNVNGQLLSGNVSYKSNRVTNFKGNGEIQSWSLHQRTIITPKTIRQIIEFALKNDWKPYENRKPLFLKDFEDYIELELKDETKFPILNENQVVLTLEEVSTGKRLNLNQELYSGEGEIYRLFDNLEKAKKFAKIIIETNANIACWILADLDKALSYIAINDVREFE